MERAEPLFRFGVVADVQYADIEVGTNFACTVRRYYRHALVALHAAVQCWREADVSFVAQLGDLIDGQNASAGATDAAMASVLAALAPLGPAIPIYHCIGNHEALNWQRDGSLLRALDYGARSYRAWSPHPRWRFVMLDPFFISTIGWPDGHPNAMAAWKLLDMHNPTDCRRRGVDLSIGLRGLERRWMPYNGAHGAEQLAWLDAELRSAVADEQKVVILTHVAVAPGACSDDCLAWDFDACLALLHGAGAGAVVAVLSGHDHAGGYVRDDAGVHHVTFCAPLETAPPNACHAVVAVHESGLVVQGYGRQPSFNLHFCEKAI